MNFLYALRDPITNEIRYIGKSENPTQRLSVHLAAEQRTDIQSHRARWIRKLLRDGKRPELTILFRVPDAMRWQVVERFFIASAIALGFRLTNSTAGGDGLSFINEADRARHSEAVRRSLSGAEVRAKISAGVLRISQNPERIARQSAFMSARMANPEIKAAMVAAITTPEATVRNSLRQSARMSDPVILAELSYSATKQWTDPELLAWRAEASRKAMIDPAARERSRRGAEIQNADQDYIRARDERWATAEAKQAAANHAKAGWSDPVKRAARIAALRIGQRRRQKREAAQRQLQAP